LFQKGDKVPTTLFFIGGRSEARHPLKEGLIRVLSKQLVSAESDRTNAEASLLSTRGLKKHQSHPITASIPGYLMVKVKGGGHSTTVQGLTVWASLQKAVSSCQPGPLPSILVIMIHGCVIKPTTPVLPPRALPSNRSRVGCWACHKVCSLH